MNKLTIGMKFENLRCLCEFIDVKYDKKHNKRLKKNIINFCTYEKTNNNNEIIITSIVENPKPYIYWEVKTQYKYNIGDIISVCSGKIKIIEQRKSILKDGKRRKSYKVKCLNEGYEYNVLECNLDKKSGRPVCNNKIIVKGVNDINSTNIKLSNLLLNKDDCYLYSENSTQKIDFKCPICRKVFNNLMIKNVNKSGVPCHCSQSKSYPNRFMYWLLEEIRINFKDEETFEWSDSRIYDFYIPSISTIIEMNGKQHYEEAFNFTNISLKEQIENDVYKHNMAINNGIKNYFQIDARRSDFNFIKNNVLKSGLSSLLDFSKVDWGYIETKCENNIMLEISKIWNSGERDVKVIGKTVGLSGGNVTKFLHKCDKFNLIEKYDKEELESIRLEKAINGIRQKNTLPVICNKLGIVFASHSLAFQKSVEATGIQFWASNLNSSRDNYYTRNHKYTYSHITQQQFNEIKSATPEKAFGDFFILPESQ